MLRGSINVGRPSHLSYVAFPSITAMLKIMFYIMVCRSAKLVPTFIRRQHRTLPVSGDWARPFSSKATEPGSHLLSTHDLY